MLTLFYRYYRPLIDAGHLYIAMPPLYKIKKGKDLSYAYTEEEKNKMVAELGGMTQEKEAEVLDIDEVVVVEETEEVTNKRNSKISLQRYKGLGEMNAEELWETTMNPATRVLKRVNIEDAEEADKVFDVLMGSDVEPRRLFIQTHAKMANIDV